MKINPNVNKKVKKSMTECRKTIVNATIQLMKQVGCRTTDVFAFHNTLLLFQHNGTTTETIIVDEIRFGDDDQCDPFYVAYFNGESKQSSYKISISNLFIIYQEVRKQVLKY